MARIFAFGIKSTRPLLGALATTPLLFTANQRRVECEAPPFQNAKCTKNEQHTHDTRKITLSLDKHIFPFSWTTKGAVGNVLVRVDVAGPAATGCCACCKCPPPCGCPKTANGCCACCKCPGTCGCPKTAAAAKPAAPEGCCACCKCPPPCGCPKTTNGCCACCKCPDKCGCPKKEAPSSSKAARPYNPLSPFTGDSVTLLVKKYEKSTVGAALHSLEPGDSVELRGPNQQWTVAGDIANYAMVAGGTGITPLIQSARQVLVKDKAAMVTFITFNNTEADVLLKDDLKKLSTLYNNRLTVIHVVGKNETHIDDLVQGKPSAELLAKHLPSPSAKGGVMIMVCGRPAMTAAVAGPKAKDFSQGELGGVLLELGYAAEQVRKV